MTKENFTFAASTVLAKYPDGLLFKVGTMAPPTNMGEGLQDCIVLVPEGSLPEAIRIAVGGFNSGAASAARKQRVEAVEGGNKEQFSKAVTGEWPVKEYYNAAEDPFGGGDPFGDKKGLGEARTWEEYQVEVAKRDAEKKESEENHAATLARRMKAIADPADTKWGWGSGGELELSAGGKAQHTKWKSPGTWEKQADGALLVLHGTTLFTITFDAEGIGKVEDANGNATRLTFRSKKEAKDAKKPKERESRLPVK
ncbi:MAG: hypothetical protein EOP83_37400 [Verrucomicrobiaceae bacterium]|nr:MAG: hypothetical protein EOP83_37400 [Verrucomicrobiaceae bacterium]